MSAPAAYVASEQRYQVATDWFRKCGKSGLQFPAISLGCWHNFGEPGTDAQRHTEEAEFHENARDILFTAFDHGITHFDLANNYGPGPGAAETRVGRILAGELRAYRDELLISTKAGYGMWPGPYGDWGSRKYLLSSLERSLERLGLKFVDIFYHHRFDPNTPLEETMGALDSAVRQGKALYTGISNYSADQTRQALAVCDTNGFFRPVIHQPNYSILNRWIEPDLLELVGEQGVGVIAFCPLAQGLLTDKYLRGIPEDSRAKQERSFLAESQVTPDLLDKLRKLNEVALSRGQSLAQMSLSWVLKDQRVTTALIGASRAAQVTENVQAAENLRFSTEELAAIDRAVAA